MAGTKEEVEDRPPTSIHIWRIGQDKGECAQSDIFPLSLPHLRNHSQIRKIRVEDNTHLWLILHPIPNECHQLDHEMGMSNKSAGVSRLLIYCEFLSDELYLPFNIWQNNY